MNQELTLLEKGEIDWERVTVSVEQAQKMVQQENPL